jgi:elongation factor 1-beta
MGVAIVTVKIMPLSPETDLEIIKVNAMKIIEEFIGEGKNRNITEEPVAFGLKAVNIVFPMNEDIGSPDVISEKIAAEVEGVNSAEISDVRRALG